MDHPAQQIDSFLQDFDLEEEWIGILGGPIIARPIDSIDIEYNVRILDGPYDGQYSAEFTYRFDATNVKEQVVLEDVYREQVSRIEVAFPDATVQYYKPSSWSDSNTD